MERLTERDEYGNADIIGVDSEDLQLHLTYYEFNLVTEALNRLASYEDTGLTPEEIKNLKTGVIPAHWGELFKAECDGRLVVLPTAPDELKGYAEELLSHACKAKRDAEAALKERGSGHEA